MPYLAADRRYRSAERSVHLIATMTPLGTSVTDRDTSSPKYTQALARVNTSAHHLENGKIRRHGGKHLGTPCPPDCSTVTRSTPTAASRRTALSTTSCTRWSRPLPSSVSPMYMPGRLRTPSSPLEDADLSATFTSPVPHRYVAHGSLLKFDPTRADRLCSEGPGVTRTPRHRSYRPLRLPWRMPAQTSVPLVFGFRCPHRAHGYPRLLFLEARRTFL